MRWLPFALIAVACLTLHTTVGARVAVGQVRPDWMLVVVVFFAMHGRGLDAVTAGWVLGLLADFQSAERFGLMSLVYALAAGGVYGVREALFRYHPLSQFAMTLAAGCVVQGLLWVYYLAAIGSGGASWSADLWIGLLAALYSALWAPLLHAGLLRLAPWLGFSPARYSHAGLARRLA